MGRNAKVIVSYADRVTIIIASRDFSALNNDGARLHSAYFGLRPRTIESEWLWEPL